LQINDFITGTLTKQITWNIHQLVNYHTDGFIKSQRNIFTFNISVSTRSSSEKVCSIPLPVLATSHRYRDKNRKRNWTNFFRGRSGRDRNVKGKNVSLWFDKSVWQANYCHTRNAIIDICHETSRI